MDQINRAMFQAACNVVGLGLPEPCSPSSGQSDDDRRFLGATAKAGYWMLRRLLRRGLAMEWGRRGNLLLTHGLSHCVLVDAHYIFKLRCVALPKCHSYPYFHRRHYCVHDGQYELVP